MHISLLYLPGGNKGAIGGGGEGADAPPPLISTLLKRGEVKCEVILKEK